MPGMNGRIATSPWRTISRGGSSLVRENSRGFELRNVSMVERDAGVINLKWASTHKPIGCASASRRDRSRPHTHKRWVSRSHYPQRRRCPGRVDVCGGKDRDKWFKDKGIWGNLRNDREGEISSPETSAVHTFLCIAIGRPSNSSRVSGGGNPAWDWRFWTLAVLVRLPLRVCVWRLGLVLLLLLLPPCDSVLGLVSSG